MEAFSAVQAKQVQDMVKSYEATIAEQKRLINQLVFHLGHHCPAMLDPIKGKCEHAPWQQKGPKS